MYSNLDFSSMPKFLASQLTWLNFNEFGHVCFVHQLKIFRSVLWWITFQFEHILRYLKDLLEVLGWAKGIILTDCEMEP